MFIKHTPPLKKQPTKQINNKPLNAPLSQSQYRETAALADQHTRVFRARALSSVEQERDQVATRGTATLGVRSVGAAVFMVVLSAHIKLHKPF